MELPHSEIGDGSAVVLLHAGIGHLAPLDAPEEFHRLVLETLG